VLQSRLSDRAAAGQHLEQAIKILRAAAPSARRTSEVLAEMEQGTVVRDRFAAELQLDSSVVVARFSRYQSQVREWHQRAMQRRDMEGRLLRRALLNGDVEAVWKLVREAESAPDSGLGQSYFDTPLPALIQARAKDLKLPAVAGEVTELFKAQRLDLVPLTATDRMLSQLAVQPVVKDWKPLLVALEQYYKKPAADRALVDAALLALVVKTLETDVPSSIALAGPLPDTLLREDSLWLVGARGVGTRKAREVLDAFNPRSFPQGAVLSFYRGCVEAAVRSN
jgi:hypothetical protein